MSGNLYPHRPDEQRDRETEEKYRVDW